MQSLTKVASQTSIRRQAKSRSTTSDASLVAGDRAGRGDLLIASRVRAGTVAAHSWRSADSSERRRIAARGLCDTTQTEPDDLGRRSLHSPRLRSIHRPRIVRRPARARRRRGLFEQLVIPLPPLPISGGLRRSWTRRRRCGPSAAPPSPNSTPSPNPSSSTCSATPPRIRKAGRSTDRSACLSRHHYGTRDKRERYGEFRRCFEWTALRAWRR